MAARAPFCYVGERRGNGLHRRARLFAPIRKRSVSRNVHLAAAGCAHQRHTERNQHPLWNTVDALAKHAVLIETPAARLNAGALVRPPPARCVAATSQST